MKLAILSPFFHRFLVVMVFLFIPLSILAPHSIVWEVIAGGLIGFYHSRHHDLVALPKPLVATLLLIPLWALVTALWAEYPLNALVTGLKVLALTLAGTWWCRFTLSLPEVTRKALAQAFLGGLLLGLAFVIGDVWSGNLWQAFWKKSSAKAFAQGSLMVSLAAWPALCWVWQQPGSGWKRLRLATGILFLILWSLFQIDCDSSFMGLFLGLCVFSGTFLWPRFSSVAMRLLVPLFVASFPFISLYAFKPEYIPAYNSYIHSSSYIDRLYVWNDIAESILDHPWRGIGMDGTRNHEKARSLRNWSYVDEKGCSHEQQTQRFPMHPHNAILQLWLELGFLGTLLGIVLFFQMTFYLYRSHLGRVEKAIGAGLFMGIFLIVWVNLGFWQNWWISGVWIITSLTFMMLKGGRENEPGYA